MKELFEKAYADHLEAMAAELLNSAKMTPEARRNALKGAAIFTAFIIQAKQWCGSFAPAGGVHLEMALSLGLVTVPSEDNPPTWTEFGDDLFKACGYEQVKEAEVED